MARRASAEMLNAFPLWKLSLCRRRLVFEALHACSASIFVFEDRGFLGTWGVRSIIYGSNILNSNKME